MNIVTKELFKRYKTAADFAKVQQRTLGKAIHSVGFYNNKSKNIIKCCKDIVKDHKGIVPNTMNELLKLAGVARKTANVVLGNSYGIPSGIAVDTHVIRLSQRLGLTEQKDPIKIERDLMAIFPQKEWIMLPHYLIWHGRAVCKALTPQCNICRIAKYCPGKKT